MPAKYFERLVQALQKDGASGIARSPFNVSQAQGLDINIAALAGYKVDTIADDSTARLDPWFTAQQVGEMAEINHIDLTIDTVGAGTVTLKIGESGDTGIPMLPGSGGKAYFGIDCKLTRSATSGIWLVTASVGSVVEFELQFSGD